MHYIEVIPSYQMAGKVNTNKLAVYDDGLFNLNNTVMIKQNFLVKNDVDKTILLVLLHPL